MRHDIVPDSQIAENHSIPPRIGDAVLVGMEHVTAAFAESELEDRPLGLAR